MRTGYLVGTGSSLETTRFSKLRICYYLCDFLATNEPVEVHESFVSWKLNTNRAYTCRNQEINKIQSWLVWPKFHCLHHSVFLSGWKNLLNLTYNLEKRNLCIKFATFDNCNRHFCYCIFASNYQFNQIAMTTIKDKVIAIRFVHNFATRIRIFSKIDKCLWLNTVQEINRISLCDLRERKD